MNFNKCTTVLALAIIAIALTKRPAHAITPAANDSPKAVLAKIAGHLSSAETIDATFISSAAHAPLVHLLFKRPNSLRVTAEYPSGRTVTAVCSNNRMVVTNSEYPNEYIETNAAFGSPEQWYSVVRIAPIYLITLIDTKSLLGFPSDFSNIVSSPASTNPSFTDLTSTKVFDRSRMTTVSFTLRYEPSNYSLKGMSMFIRANGSGTSVYERVVRLKINAKIPPSAFQSVLSHSSTKVSTIPKTYAVLSGMPLISLLRNLPN